MAQLKAVYSITRQARSAAAAVARRFGADPDRHRRRDRAGVRSTVVVDPDLRAARLRRCGERVLPSGPAHRLCRAGRQAGSSRGRDRADARRLAGDTCGAGQPAQDVVHRVVGRPGIVIIAEGRGRGPRDLLANEVRRVRRVAGDYPVHDIVVGNGDGEVALDKLQMTLMKLPRVHQGRRDRHPGAPVARGRHRQPADPEGARPHPGSARQDPLGRSTEPLASRTTTTPAARSCRPRPSRSQMTAGINRPSRTVRRRTAPKPGSRPSGVSTRDPHQPHAERLTGRGDEQQLHEQERDQHHHAALPGGVANAEQVRNASQQVGDHGIGQEREQSGPEAADRPRTLGRKTQSDTWRRRAGRKRGPLEPAPSEFRHAPSVGQAHRSLTVIVEAAPFVPFHARVTLPKRAGHCGGTPRR